MSEFFPGQTPFIAIPRRTFLAGITVAAAARFVHAADSIQPLRVAVIGHTGRGDYGHGLHTMWAKVPDTQVVAVADANPKGLSANMTKLGLAAGYADYRKMLTEIKPDIVVVAMRHLDQHRDAVLAACAAGARGIYIEKSLCRTPAEADEIVAASQRVGCRLSIAHRNRFHPVLPVVRKLIADGAIGKVLELHGRGKEDHRGGGEDLHVLGSHVLNLANFIGGAPRSCSAIVLQEGRPIEKRDVKEGAEGIGPLAGDEIHARYEMESGVPLFFDSIKNAGVKDANFGLQIVGNKGIIDLRIDVEPLAHVMLGNPFWPKDPEPRSWRPISTAGIDIPEPIADLGRDIASHRVAGIDLVAAIRENRATLCDAEQGRTVMEMIAGVFESQRQDGRRVALPLVRRNNPIALD